MNKARQYEDLWNFKNGRQVLTGKPAIEMSVWVGTPNITHHQIAYSILRTLVENPEIALEWSKNWGLTRVYVGFETALKTSFALRRAENIKLSTKKEMDSSVFLSAYENKSGYKIRLNDQKVTFEGFVIQIQRLVDELVWSVYRSGMSQEELNATTYKAAATEVLEKGLTFEYASSSEIAESFDPKGGVFVRIYGNSNGKSKVPEVIGSVDLNPAASVAEEILRITENCGDSSRRRISHCEYSPTGKVVGTRVICGISAIKKPHLGHFFMLCFARLIARHFDESHVSVEVNDYGPRIIGTFAATAVRLGIPALEVVHLLKNDLISPEDLQLDYSKRLIGGSEYDELKLLISDNLNLRFPAVYKNYNKFIRDAGMENIVSRTNLSTISDLILSGQLSEKGEWSRYGIEYIKVSGKFLLIKYEGLYTADMCRLAIVSDSREKVIYVDSGESVSRIKRVVYPMDSGMHSRSGCYVGFGGCISSSSGGNFCEIDAHGSTFENLSARDAEHATQFFILTNEETVCVTESETLSDSFFDFQVDQDLGSHIMRAFTDLKHFRETLASIVELLEADQFRQEGDARLTTTIEMNLKRAANETEFEKLFPKPKRVAPSPSFTRAVQLLQKISIDKTAMMNAVVRIVCDGIKDINIITRILTEAGIIKPTTNTFLLSSERVVLNYSEILKARGYKGQVLHQMVLSYLSGTSVFQKKCSITFETLSEFVRRFPELQIKENRVEVLQLVQIVRSRLGNLV